MVSGIYNRAYLRILESTRTSMSTAGVPQAGKIFDRAGTIAGVQTFQQSWRVLRMCFYCGFLCFAVLSVHLAAGDAGSLLG